jgi:hypothetical protein
MSDKRLWVNLYRYGKFFLFGLAFALFSGYTLYTVFFMGGARSPPGGFMLAGLGFMFAAGTALTFYALLSCAINKSVFGTQALIYRTLFKRFHQK